MTYSPAKGKPGRRRGAEKRGAVSRGRRLAFSFFEFRAALCWDAQAAPINARTCLTGDAAVPDESRGPIRATGKRGGIPDGPSYLAARKKIVAVHLKPLELRKNGAIAGRDS